MRPETGHRTGGRLDVSHNQLLKALHNNGCQCNRPIIVMAGWVGLFWNWYYCGGFEILGNSFLAQGGIKDIRKDILELFRTLVFMVKNI